MIRGTLPDANARRVLEVSDVSVRFGPRTVLDGVSFHVPVGEFACLVGPNGAGKSTLLKAILGLLPVDSGAISISGMDIDSGRARVGYVPQRKGFDRDFPATPLEVVVANLRGRWPLRIRPKERERAMAALERVDATRLEKAQMRDLSGGETQRVFLARALVTDPELLILDEPTAGVDVGGRAAIIDLLAEISASDTLAALLVTHNLQAIARCSERVVYLEHSIRAWGLWHELTEEDALKAIQFDASAPDAHLDAD